MAWGMRRCVDSHGQPTSEYIVTGCPNQFDLNDKINGYAFRRMNRPLEGIVYEQLGSVGTWRVTFKLGDPLCWEIIA